MVYSQGKKLSAAAIAFKAWLFEHGPSPAGPADATRAEPFAAHSQVFVAPTDHPLLRFGDQTVESLRPYGFIVREPGSGSRAAMEQFFQSARLEPKVIMEMGSNETIKQAVMAGMGLSFLSLNTLGRKALR